MDSVAGNLTLQMLSERQRLALISLLGDDDPATYSAVRSKILSIGPAVEQWLRPLTISNDPVVRRRAKEILECHARLNTTEAFLRFCRNSSEHFDLETGTLLLAQSRYPSIKPEGYTALLDMWGAELQGRLAGIAADEARLGEFNRFVFADLKFNGNALYEQDPDCCYLNRILDKRTGNPIGLSAVYLFLARRAQLPVVGIGVPGHFICRYQSASAEIYVDCFRSGALLSRSDCLRQLKESRIAAVGSVLHAATPRQILTRMCRNLVMTYGHLELNEEAARTQSYLEALICMGN